MIRVLVAYLPSDWKQNIKRVISYYRANGFVQTFRKIAIKVQQTTIFRFQKKSSGGDLYDHIRSAIDDEHPEYKHYNKYSSCEHFVKYVAFYLPQFHQIPENDEWWGTGFTEWTNVTRALPQYIGHQQPRRPADLGFYNLRNNEVRRKQIVLAKNYGIYGFCYHYYWFSGKTLLDHPINALLDDKSLDFPFCINWANENWTRRWDGKESDVLLGQTYSDEDYLEFIKDVSKYLLDERYIRIKSKPLLIVYRPSLIPDVKRMTDIWRDYCRDNEVGELYLVLTHSFDTTDPVTIGFDAAVEFAPNNMPLKGVDRNIEYINKNFSGNIYDYNSAVEQAEKYSQPSYTKYRSVCPSWDNEARKTGKGTVLDGATPSLYKKWLDIVNEQTAKHNAADDRYVFINAWNEWAEGAYLEPDKKFGFAYLEATRDALNNALRNALERRIVLVSHDAHPHGAQYLLLHIAQHLYQKLKFNVDIIFLGDGELLHEFEQFANVRCLYGNVTDNIDLLFSELYDNGCRSVIFNTVVTGAISGAAKNAGFRIVSLVHEMPELIKKTGLKGAAELISENSDLIVFPAALVKQGFEEVVGNFVSHSVVQPQGLFRNNRLSYRQPFSESHSMLCKKLGISDSSRIILNVGYGDYRKGIDLFVDIAGKVHKQLENVYFVWVGHTDPVIESECRKKIKRLGLAEYVIFTGKNFDTDLYYAGADIFALTSREDPFPSVVLEALDAGRPVMGFAGAGGFSDIVSRDVGVLVDGLDTRSFAVEITALLSDKARDGRYSKNARRIIDEEFNFTDYVYKLLDYSGSSLKKISVIIPNYNYEGYLSERLQTVLAQSYPIYELIVLDDCSQDGSVELIKSELEKTNIDYRVIVNEHNSGSVFDQWYKGVLLAKGDYVWIAEADDYSDAEFLEKLLVPFDDDVVMSYCESYQVDSDGEIIAQNYHDYVSDISDSKWLCSYVNDGVDEIKTCLSVKNTIPNVSSVVFKRDNLLAVLKENIDQIKQYRVAGDWVTYLYLLESGKIAYCPEQLNYHRRHDSSVTLSKFDNALLAEIMSVQKFVRDNYMPAAKDVEKSERYAQELYEQFGLNTVKFPNVSDNADIMNLVK